MSTSAVSTAVDPVLAPLLGAREAATLCGLGLSTWWRHLSAGKIPAPVRIGGSVRWRREELYAWMEASCPPREKWEAMANRRAGKR
jgi:excisionase family DNA binding protein